MRIVHAPRVAVALLALALGACVAPALLLPSSGQLMGALLRPLVGFDPNAANLFEQPIVRERMTALLGQRYDTALTLLRTADELQREGPLFFVVSRYTPIPELADRVGLVWNADTNQMAAAILKGDAVEVFSERIERAVVAEIGSAETAAVEQAVTAAEELVPVWPSAMRAWIER
jgi:hypothetical protein